MTSNDVVEKLVAIHYRADEMFNIFKSVNALKTAYENAENSVRNAVVLSDDDKNHILDRIAVSDEYVGRLDDIMSQAFKEIKVKRKELDELYDDTVREYQGIFKEGECLGDLINNNYPEAARAMKLGTMLGKVECGKDLLDDMINELLNGEQNDKQKKL